MDTRKMLDSDWVKANVNTKDGDQLRFIDEGVITKNKEGKDQLILNVEVVRAGRVVATKKFQANKTNNKVLAGLWGFDSKNWIGKELKVNVVKKNDPSGKLVDSVVLSDPNEKPLDFIPEEIDEVNLD